MSRKEWDKAMVYAEDAAESWANWAMVCAARCAEGAERWEQAETWYQRNAERYPIPALPTGTSSASAPVMVTSRPPGSSPKSISIR